MTMMACLSIVPLLLGPQSNGLDAQLHDTLPWRRSPFHTDRVRREGGPIEKFLGFLPRLELVDLNPVVRRPIHPLLGSLPSKRLMERV